MNTVNFIKSAEYVAIRQTGRNKGDIILTVNDSEVPLNRRHPIAIASSLTTPADAAASLQGGHFTIVTDDQNKSDLKEYRDSSYKGFIQTQEFLDRFGTDETLHARGLERFSLNEFGLGGDFDLTTGFTWSAFSQNLQTQVSVMRQVCSNGMIARNRLFEREVPVINLFDHHLDIAARQLIDVSRRLIVERIEKMGREHAMAKEVDLVRTHIEKRLRQNPGNDRLNKLQGAIEIYGDISEYYTQRAVKEGIAQALPSPISRFDLWNITTELNSHTEQLVESTSSSLDRIASGLLFPKKDLEGVIVETSQKSTFGSPEQAFFGA